ncbi:MAG: D-aminoacylase [Gemmatimonadota bacterium]
MTTDRRAFLASMAATALTAANLPTLASAPWVRRRTTYDLVLRGGLVFDGTGAPGITGDVAIAGDRIALMARHIAGMGTEEIDARHLAVAPGFIDIHSHGDSNMREDPRQESVIRQGITTIIVGQDGDSWSPRARNDAGDGSVDSFEAFFATVDQIHPSVNLASMIGLGAVRGAVVGDVDRRATPEELARMVAMVEAALAQGACGASTGLEYTPGAFASTEELVALSRPLARRRLPYATHMRNEDDQVLDSIDEAIRIAKGAGCPLEISHLKMQGPRNWPKLDDAFARIAAARKSGMDVTFDRYPYIAYHTGLDLLFPNWTRDGGTDAFMARLDSTELTSKIKAYALDKVELIGGWDNVLISSTPSDQDKIAEGKRLGAYAQSLGRDPFDVSVMLLKNAKGDVGMVGFAMDEPGLDRLYRDPHSMICSDGGAFAKDGPTHRGSPHPRGAGSFPRVIARYVRERKVMTLATAIHKMTGLPASRVHLSDRGHLAKGMAADVVVFDPATIADTATFENPFSYAIGIEAVIVNGSVAVRQAQRSEGTSGKSLTPAQA